MCETFLGKLRFNILFGKHIEQALEERNKSLNEAGSAGDFASFFFSSFVYHCFTVNI